MSFIFVGTHPEFLDSGRPIVFGDRVDDADVCERLKDVLVPVPVPPVAATAPVLAPAPAAPTAPAAVPDPDTSKVAKP